MQRPRMQVKATVTVAWSVAIVVGSLSCTHGVPVRGSGGVSLRCGAGLSEYVNRWWPGYRLVTVHDLSGDVQESLKERRDPRSLMCVEGEFTGGGEIDVALLVRSVGEPREEMLVVLRTEGQEVKGLTLDRWDERCGDFSIHVVTPGTYKNWDGSEKATIVHPGVGLELFESASRVYYWQEKGFEALQTGE